MGPDPKPTRLSRAVDKYGDGLRGDVVPQQLRDAARQGEVAVGKAVAQALLPFLLRDDGWLRVVPQEDGEAVYWKWKWTGGKHIHHYVMAVYPASESAEALRTLAKKMDAVDRGVEAPVKDHYFKR